MQNTIILKSKAKKEFFFGRSSTLSLSEKKRVTGHMKLELDNK